MKRYSIVFIALCLLAMAGFAQQAKYVFFFIGDGMGVNHVNTTEVFQGEMEGRRNPSLLLMSTFPYTTVATTYSLSNRVTDSSASGTALATGHKTNNGVLGMLPDKKTAVSSIGVWAKRQGARVGVSTSVSIDHATPGAFYAHQPSRKNYYEIGKQLASSGFDFFAGSDFLQPTGKRGDQPSLYSIVEEAGYTIYRGYDAYAKGNKQEKVLLLQPEGKPAKSIPYAIDRQADDLSLQQIVKAGIDFFSRDLSKGFFFMVEGGQIDWANHSHDAGTMVQEVIDLDKAVNEAYQFYLQHPDETLIVITADHETGGLGMGRDNIYELNTRVLAQQKMSERVFSSYLNNLRKDTKNKVTWEMVQKALKENFGFWDEIRLTAKQEERLKRVYTESFSEKEVALKESEYQKDEPLSATAIAILSEQALLGWTSGGHTAEWVPVFAIGAGANLFCKRTDNAEIPRLIAKAAGYIPE